jgi:hypothetical protein
MQAAVMASCATLLTSVTSLDLECASTACARTLKRATAPHAVVVSASQDSAQVIFVVHGQISTLIK